MGKDTESYCRYLKYKVHKTDDCRILKRYIEKLIERGILKEFVAGRDRSRTPPRRNHSQAPFEKSSPSHNMRVINLIAGGFGAGGEGSHAREVYATQISTTVHLGKRPRPEEDIVISFSEDDLEHVTTLHTDALVITVDVDGCDMKRILIDGGSSTNILFLDAFEEMDKSKRDLKRVDFPLIDFAGRTNYPLGAITLLVILGE